MCIFYVKYKKDISIYKFPYKMHKMHKKSVKPHCYAENSSKPLSAASISASVSTPAKRGELLKMA